jgi:hypothetical protein
MTEMNTQHNVDPQDDIKSDSTTQSNIEPNLSLQRESLPDITNTMQTTDVTINVDSNLETHMFRTHLELLM